MWVFESIFSALEIICQKKDLNSTDLLPEEDISNILFHSSLALSNPSSILG